MRDVLFYKPKIFLNFEQILEDIFSIRLLRGSTYTRVNTAVDNSH